jgi:predicted Zn-dependent protease
MDTDFNRAFFSGNSYESLKEIDYVSDDEELELSVPSFNPKFQSPVSVHKIVSKYRSKSASKAGRKRSI